MFSHSADCFKCGSVNRVIPVSLGPNSRLVPFCLTCRPNDTELSFYYRLFKHGYDYGRNDQKHDTARTLKALIEV